jgi:uncharacterized protein
MRIVMTGGTGFLGTGLVDRLRALGHVVTVVTRRAKAQGEVEWNLGGSVSALTRALDGADAVINLAGAPIDRRWTKAHKRELWESRVTLTRVLVDAMQRASLVPSTLINGSAMGIYGDRGDEPLTEASAPGTGFLASLAEAWEKEALAAAPRTRVVLLRTGLVLDKDGGALPKVALPFRFFVGGPVGSGRQYLSWIHRSDWVSMVIWALTNTVVSGPLNVTAPHPATNREFTRTLGRAMSRPALIPAPEFALRVILGEMADVVVHGQRVLPAKAHELGFGFSYPLLEPALRAIYQP